MNKLEQAMAQDAAVQEYVRSILRGVMSGEIEAGGDPKQELNYFLKHEDRIYIHAMEVRSDELYLMLYQYDGEFVELYVSTSELSVLDE